MYFREVIGRDIFPKDLIFTKHFLKNESERPISKEMVLEYLLSKELIYEEYDEARDTHKVVYPMSGKYHLILVLGVDLQTTEIRIVTAIKSNKKLERLIRKKGVLMNKTRRKLIDL